MEQATSNTAVAVTTEQNKVTQQLLMDFLKQTLGNLPQNQQAQFLAIAQAFNLNPWKREIYAVKYGQNFNVIVGYETYLKRAEEHPQYDGYETKFSGEGNDMACTCTVYRKDRNHPTSHTVYLAEYRGQGLWGTKPRMMLEKVALSTALRRAFPLEFGGMPYTSEELGNLSDSEKLEQQGFTEVKAEPVQEAPQQPEPAPAPKKTQAERDANYQKACMELRDRNPEVFDTFLKNHALKGVMDIKTPAGRKKFIDDVTATINAATEQEV
jgi:hypothetical protein